jgi:CBS domain containing-hemolysin-like protein
MALFLILAALHWRALSCLKGAPESGVDLRHLRMHLGACLVYVSVGVLSIVLLKTLPYRIGFAASGFVYAFIGPAHYLYYRLLVPRFLGMAPPT